jgi:RNA polymerase sigma factor (TIGR02999 family)
MAVAELSTLIDNVRQGRKATVDQLFEVMYPELRRIALAQMRREKRTHSWQPTLLVNEVYLELLKNPAFDEPGVDEERRRAFLGLAGFLMKRLLVLHSRPLSQKTVRAGEDALTELSAAQISPDNILYVEDLLKRLEAVDPRVRSLVELRIFQGKSTEEVAAAINCSVRTAGTLWAFARRWLEAEMSGSNQ